MDQGTNKKLASLAGYLLEREDIILKKWADQVMNKSEETSAIAALSKNEFYNSIPDSLHNFCNQLRYNEGSVEDFSRKHGSQRWEYGINLPLLTEEWNNLYFILVDEIHQAHESLDLSLDTLKLAQKQLSTFILHSIKTSVDQYYRLEKQQAEAQLGALENSVKKVNSFLQKRGHNLHSATHDMGGGMVILQLNLDLLKQTNLNTEARELVDQLTMATDNLSQLMDNLLSLFRLEAGREELKIEEFDAAEMLQNLAKTMQTLADEKNIDLRTEGTDELKVRGDKIKVKRIAQNLVLNSLKYTKEGFVKISWKLQTDDKWLMEIEDTGPGLDEINASLFTNTSENREDYKQTVEVEDDFNPAELRKHSEGIGLLIVRQLCGLLDAIVKIDSTESGTVFKIVLPVDYSE